MSICTDFTEDVGLKVWQCLNNKYDLCIKLDWNIHFYLSSRSALMYFYFEIMKTRFDS